MLLNVHLNKYRTRFLFIISNIYLNFLKVANYFLRNLPKGYFLFFFINIMAPSLLLVMQFKNFLIIQLIVFLIIIKLFQHFLAYYRLFQVLRLLIF